MSTTTWHAPCKRRLQDSQLLRAVRLTEAGVADQIVSQKMLAVSASAIGVVRCSGCGLRADVVVAVPQFVGQRAHPLKTGL